MKLLIDIPEHVYEHAKEMSEDSRDEAEAMRAIANGSPARCKGMDEAEKERLIKKDIVSIENRVRHAFNQGYEMGLKTYKEKLNCTDCIIDGTDACSRGAGRAVDDEICGDFMSSRSEIPNTCGDAVSRQAVLDVTWEEPSYTDALNVLTEVRDKVKVLPSVTPQRRTGRWIKTRLDDEPDKICDDCGTYCWKCSICGNDASGWGNFKYCPKCGAKMEVEE
jgi:rubrerythrin